jgi:N-acetylglucosaminyldiphosphoundecaprenol N-acetyl-beta-D-mannosaminyltransferase
MNGSQTEFFRVPFTFDRRVIAETVERSVAAKSKGYVCMVNANLVSSACRDTEVRNALANSMMNLCDGSVIALLRQTIWFRKTLPYPGPDFFLDVIRLKKYRSAFVGCTDEILAGLRTELAGIDPAVAGMLFMPLPFFNNAGDFDLQGIAAELNKAKPDIIWVSLGAPKQELFMQKLLPFLDRGILAGVGAAFLFSSGIGKHRRAPRVIRKMRLEWLYRVIFEPAKSYGRLYNEVRYISLLTAKEVFLRLKRS